MRNQIAAGESSIGEPIIDPDLPIVDAHHHLWFLPDAVLAAMESRNSLSARALAPTFRSRPRYLLDEFLHDAQTGHNIRATVHVDAHAMYRASGPPSMRSVGEVEFVNGVAAMAASGAFGEIKVCAAIVGGVDLSIGDPVEVVLAEHIRAGGSRYRGVRSAVVFDEDLTILGAGAGAPRLLADATFRRGFKLLERFGLLFEAWLLEPQLPDLIELAYAFPNIQIILDHVGGPLGIGRYAGRRLERFPIWRDNIFALANCSNVAVKLGGLGVPFGGFESYRSEPPATSTQLADEWRPYIETCIEAFGVHRCMFESNFPIDSAVCSYAVLWNAFKRIAAGASEDEKAALFGGTATRIYRLDT
jgi:L-fuconolactonase